MATHEQSEPIATSTSCYAEFRVRQPHMLDEYSEANTILDKDGAALYETEYRRLLLSIIKLNDVSTLMKYLAKHPQALGPGETQRDDPFLTAAYFGSTDALRVLLDHYAIDPNLSQTAPNERGDSLLNVACRNAHVETVRFLLDNQSSYGDTHAWQQGGMTALLSAAASFVNSTHAENDKRDSMRDHVARSEELMQLLLDRGACASDAYTRSDETLQPRDTVLSLAISQASARLVARLINEGADVHGKTRCYSQGDFFGARGGSDDVFDVTPLHIGSFYLNTEGIQVLLDHRGNDIEVSHVISCRDSFGCLPLHWAASGLDHQQYDLMSLEEARIILMYSRSGGTR